jgi:hypothetical protein
MSDLPREAPEPTHSVPRRTRVTLPLGALTRFALVDTLRHQARSEGGHAWSAYLPDDSEPFSPQFRTKHELVDWLRSPEGAWDVQKAVEGD